jgi:hypothetical protein
MCNGYVRSSLRSSVQQVYQGPDDSTRAIFIAKEP